MERNHEPDVLAAAALGQRRDQFKDMCRGFSSETTCTISQKIVETLDTEIAALKLRLEPAPKNAGMIATDTVPDTALCAKRIVGASITQARDKKGVVAIIVLSRPGRRYYMSQSFADKLRRQAMRVQVGRQPVSKRLDSAGLKARAGELVKKVQQEVGKRVKEDAAKPLCNLEGKLKTWAFPRGSAINALHEAFDWRLDCSDEASYWLAQTFRTCPDRYIPTHLDSACPGVHLACFCLSSAPL